MRTIIKIASWMAAALVCTSCSGDYLDTKPTGSTDQLSVFATTDKAALAVNGLCKMMTDQYLEKQGMNGEGTIKMWYGNYPGNHFYVNLPGWSNLINSNYHDNTSSIYTYYPWYYYYKLIGNANILICEVDKAEGPEEEKQFVKAQALTIRAYSYMMLVQLYCNRWSDHQGNDDGVVLRLDESMGGMPLSKQVDVYKQIYKDLDDAISLYQESGLTRDEGFKPDVNVAYATYARTALNRQDYATAAQMATKAYDGYPLMGEKDYKSGFSEPTDEWIWYSYGSVDENLHYYSYFAYIGYDSNASNVRSYPKCISKEIYEKIPKTDIRRELFLDPTGYKYTTSSGKVSKGSDLDELTRETYKDLKSNATVYAYMQFKVKCKDLPGVGYLNHFRSSEMYLIEAEAKYFLGDIAGAQQALETLTRDTKRDEEYTCTKTGNDLLEEIKLYRAIELWGEGFDWFDAKRWGDSIVRKNSKNGGNFLASLAVTYGPEDKNNWTWMIPLKESDYNSALTDNLPE